MTNGTKWRKIDVGLTAHGRGYALLCQARAGVFYDFAESFDEILASFRVQD